MYSSACAIRVANLFHFLKIDGIGQFTNCQLNAHMATQKGHLYVHGELNIIGDKVYFIFIICIPHPIGSDVRGRGKYKFYLSSPDFTS